MTEIISRKVQAKRMVNEFGIELSDKGDGIPAAALEASQAASVDLMRKYDLGDDEVPCILIFEKWVRQPLAVETKGAADAEKVLDFLKALKVIQGMMSLADKFKMKRIVDEANARMENIIVNRSHYENAIKKRDNAIADVRRQLTARGISAEEVSTLINGRDDKPFIDQLAVFANDRGKAGNDTIQDIVRAIKEDKIFGERSRSLVRWTKQAETFGRKLDKLGAIQGTDELTDLYETYKKQKTEFEDLLERFRTSFLWKSRVQPLVEFFSRAASFGKELKDPMEVLEKLAKLTKGGEPSKS